MSVIDQSGLPSLRGTCAETEDATRLRRCSTATEYGLRGTCAETEDATNNSKLIIWSHRRVREALALNQRMQH